MLHSRLYFALGEAQWSWTSALAWSDPVRILFFAQNRKEVRLLCAEAELQEKAEPMWFIEWKHWTLPSNLFLCCLEQLKLVSQIYCCLPLCINVGLSQAWMIFLNVFVLVWFKLYICMHIIYMYGLKYLHLPKFAAGGPWGLQLSMHTAVCCSAYTVMWGCKNEGRGPFLTTGHFLCSKLSHTERLHNWLPLATKKNDCFVIEIDHFSLGLMNTLGNTCWIR